MMRQRAASAGVLALVVLATTAGAAGAQTTADPRETARMHFGPVYVTPSLALRDVGVDTNVFNEWTDPKSDFTATVAPKADAWLMMTRRFLLSTSTELGLVYFKSFTNQRSVNPRVNARLDVRFTRVSLFGENQFAWSRERANLELDARLRRRVNTTRAGFVFSATPKLSIEAALYRTGYDYEANASLSGIDLKNALQRNRRGLQVEATQRLTSRTTVFVAFETQRERFEFAGFKNADGFRLTPGVRFSPRALISGEAQVGIRRFKPLSPDVPDFQGVVAKASISHTLFGATRATLDVDRDLDYSFEPTEPYYVHTAWGGSVRRQVVGDIDLVANVRRGRLAYRAFGPVPAQGARRDTYWQYGLDLGYRLNRQSRVGFAVNRVERESSVGTTRSFRGLVAGLTVTYGG
ncbi:MAG: outer membrane beta-barrel protein [Vicinamibacterales bacterium]|jgi:hypothetical protein